MRRILIWGRILPFEASTPGEILAGNRIASNSGNMLFTASVVRTVMTEDAELEYFYSEDVPQLLADVEGMNETYACAVIPLANAFRFEFKNKLRELTRFIQAARFPCYIVGVGAQARNAQELRDGFSFDADVQAFVRAVLEKSAMLGLRGEATAAYLQRLGFLPEKHFTVIGCPSSYIAGENCAQMRVKPYDAIQKVSINAAMKLPKGIEAVVQQGMDEFEEVHFMMQTIYEFWSLYFPYSRARSLRSAAKCYPGAKDHPLWKAGRVMGFLRAHEWIDFMRGMDFSFGGRIHGNMSAMVAGTPAILLASDTRVRELADYHGIPFVDSEKLTAETRLRDLYENADFAAFECRYQQNFQHYVDFLNQNGIQHVYDGSYPAEKPLDKAVAAMPKTGAITSNMKVPLKETLKYTPKMYGKLVKYKVDKIKREKGK